MAVNGVPSCPRRPPVGTLWVLRSGLGAENTEKWPVVQMTRFSQAMLALQYLWFCLCITSLFWNVLSWNSVSFISPILICHHVLMYVLTDLLPDDVCWAISVVLATEQSPPAKWGPRTRVCWRREVKELVRGLRAGAGWGCICAVCSAAGTVTELLLEFLQRINGRIDWCFDKLINYIFRACFFFFPHLGM